MIRVASDRVMGAAVAACLLSVPASAVALEEATCRSVPALVYSMFNLVELGEAERLTLEQRQEIETWALTSLSHEFNLATQGLAWEIGHEKFNEMVDLDFEGYGPADLARSYFDHVLPHALYPDSVSAHADAGEMIRRLDLFAGTVEVLCEEDMGIVSP